MRLDDLAGKKTPPSDDLATQLAREQIKADAEYRSTLTTEEKAYYDFENFDRLTALGVKAGWSLALNKGKPRPEPEIEFFDMEGDAE